MEGPQATSVSASIHLAHGMVLPLEPDNSKPCGLSPLHLSLGQNFLRLKAKVSPLLECPGTGAANLCSGDSHFLLLCDQLSSDQHILILDLLDIQNRLQSSTPGPQTMFSFLDDPASLCFSPLIQINSERLIYFLHF